MINLLDTPGHEDFSEDTYRTLTAVDSALMVIDGAKGVDWNDVLMLKGREAFPARLEERFFDLIK